MKIDVVLGRIFFFIIVLVVAFMFLEYLSIGFISTRAPVERVYSVEDIRHPKPYVMFGGKPGTRDLNQLGYRGPVPHMPKTANEYRILMLGGSTVLIGTPPISGLLEQEFRENGYPNVRIYNLGVMSSISTMELVRVALEASELSPDLVVMYNGGNDILHPWSWDPRLGYPFNYIAFENNPLLESDVQSYPAIAMFAYGSNIARFLFGPYFRDKFVPLDETRDMAGWDTPEWREAIADKYVSNLVKAGRISRSFGSGFMAFLQPLAYFKMSLANEEEVFLTDSDEKNYAVDMRSRIVSRMEKASEDPSVNIVDLSHIYLDVKPHVFVDTIHTRQITKSKVAAEMYRNIINSDMKPIKGFH